MKIIYVLPHPIQYQTPLINYLKLKGLDITVVYKSDHTSKKYYDNGFKKKIQGFFSCLFPELLSISVKIASNVRSIILFPSLF